MIVEAVQRWRARRASYRPAGEVFDPRRFNVAPIADDITAKRFVLEHHYAASYPAARFRFGLFQADELVGVAVFAAPFPSASRSLPGSAPVELSRFVLLDQVRANAETWMLARCFELLHHQADVVLSFADPMFGHVGTIYQAHNAVYSGQAGPRTVRVLPNGRVMSARAISKIRAGERGWRYSARLLEAFGAPALECPELGRAWLQTWLPRLTSTRRHPGNHRYLWALDRRIRRHLGPSLPYPKLGGVS